MRFHKKFQGRVCKRCLHKLFFEYAGISAVAGWWGVISMIVNPFMILIDIFQYLTRLTMPPVPANAKFPQLTQMEIDRLEPETTAIFQRLNTGANLETVVTEIARRENVTPGQVILFLRQKLNQQAQGSAAPAPVLPKGPTRPSVLPLPVAAGIVIFCGVIAYAGWNQKALEMSFEPKIAKLSDLAGKSSFENRHVKITDGLALYPLSVFSTWKRTQQGKTTEEGLNYTYYLLVPNDRSVLQNFQITQTAAGPAMTGVAAENAIVVKTHRFSKKEEIPQEPAPAPEVEGIVMNQLESITVDEGKLLKETFPNLDTRKTVFIAENKMPFMHDSIWVALFCAAVSVGAILLHLSGKKSLAKFEQNQKMKNMGSGPVATG
jgi:hypothetical protein